ncbi:DMT family transporter [Porticoccus sp. GXU_MW_L64]
MKILVCTVLALLAFAGNSILCRLALAEGVIDAGSFTAIRLLSGAITLLLLVSVLVRDKTEQTRSNWKGALYLFVYAAAFSYAYISLPTGIGALLLFGTVQITIIVAGLWSGNKLTIAEWVGALVAFSGFVYLVLPTSYSAPAFAGSALMCLAGIAWGLYTLAGKGAQNPLLDTARYFLHTMPMVAVLLAIVFPFAQLSSRGVMLAIVSGALTSGVGYAIWYVALKGITSVQAAVVQLLVPVIAAVGGVVFAGEGITLRLLLASVLILGGVLVVIWGKVGFRHSRAGGNL